MTTQLEEVSLELKLKGIDVLLLDNPKSAALLKERLLTIAEIVKR